MNIDIRDIVTDEILNLQESFANATGFGVVFTDKDGNHIGEGSNFQKICQAINATEEGKASCAMSNHHAIDLALKTGKPSIYVCHAGMVNIEIPIVIDGEFIGAFTAGQVFSEDMSNFPCEPVPKPIAWHEKKPFSDYYNEVPILRSKQVQGTANALDNLAKYIVGVYKSQHMSQELLEKNERLHQSEIKERILKEELAEMRFQALQKQITPHFIFNVLNAVIRLIDMKQYDTAQNILTCFSRMFRVHFSEENSLINLQQEINYIEDYLYINQIRFGDRLKYTVKISPELWHLRIPLFSLQPFVENALTHGLLTKETGGRLQISGSIDGNRALIVIADNGQGISPLILADIQKMIRDILEDKEVSKSKFYGIYNCVQRLKLSFGSSLNIKLKSSSGAGTKIAIRIPCDAQISC